MSQQNKLGISLHDFDVHGNCLADIWFPVSGISIMNFKVKQGPGGGIIVHMPSKMGTTWTIDEIKWAEVREQVTEKYRNSIDKPSILVEFRDFDESNNCNADITLCELGIRVKDFKVMPGLGGGIMVHMPSWMHTRWSYPEVQWSDVRQLVTREYWNTVTNKRDTNKSNNKNTQKQEDSYCSFYLFKEKVKASVDVIFYATGTKVSGINLSHKKNDVKSLRMFMPLKMQNQWNVNDMEWEQLVEIMIAEYHRQVLYESGYKVPDKLNVRFYNRREESTCMVDLKLPHKMSILKGFRIKRINGNCKLIISTPNWMNRWNDKKISWYDLCSIISNEYSKYTASKEQSDLSDLSLQNAISLSADGEMKSNNGSTEGKVSLKIKEKNELGRIKNADNSPFVFYPRTVLRVEETSVGIGLDSKKRLFDLVAALNRGSLGGIGPFEINILEWINKLRYVTSPMVLDLIEAGYVSFGWRNDVTVAKLRKIINRMSDYNLINLTRFMTVNDEGELINQKHSNMRIITMGRNGSILLHELGKSTSHFNAFDIFQDGNTVRRYLAVNQWLIYWLKTYKEEIGENYETNCVVCQKGIEFLGARMYAMVTLNDYTMIAEPVRRAEQFEIEGNKQRLREKIERIMVMFNNVDQLYQRKDEINFPQRPIIVFVCEDDDHIAEVLEEIKSVLPNDNAQNVWFTSDLRIFNYDERGKRFFSLNDGELQIVNMMMFLGKDNELDNGI